MYYGRIAARYPKQFRMLYMLCRSEEKARWVAEETGFPAISSEERCAAANPDFVVVAVKKSAGCQVTLHWAAMGFPVLCETPAGASMEQLDLLWQAKLRGARIQVAEQYHRYPIMAAGLKAVSSGLLGDPYAAHVSVAHDYHGVSLIRRALGVVHEPVRIWGRSYEYPVTVTDSRQGPVTDGSVALQLRTVMTLEFASGKTGFYDFTGVQYRSFIRSRHINVRGQNGEWNDSMIRYVGEDHLPAEQRLFPRLDPAYEPLHTESLKALVRVWNPALSLDTAQDEYAIATMLYDMRAYLETGKDVYSLEEALEDAYIWLLMKQASREPGTVVSSEQILRDVRK